jgi:hypothetical protein
MEYKRKQMVLDLDKPDEKELNEWINSKDHGFFSNKTKLHWLEVMRKEKEDAHGKKME